ncbi:MAG: hypothetical protein ACFB9M_20015 [Myxococcota bacterium]
MLIQIAWALWAAGGVALVWLLSSSLRVRQIVRLDQQLRSSLVDLAILLAERRVEKGDHRPAEAVFGEVFRRIIKDIDDDTLYAPPAGGQIGGWSIALALLASGGILMVPAPWDLAIGGAAVLFLLAILTQVGTPGTKERFAEDQDVDAFLQYASPQVRSQLRWGIERLRSLKRDGARAPGGEHRTNGHGGDGPAQG